jgi:hypothetical protein
LQAAIAGDAAAQTEYQALVQQHAAQLARCRQQTWPRKQAIWLRLYPCDTRPGALEEVLDHIVEKGYNEVYIEAFYDSQVLLPANDNPTPWISVVRDRGQENVDLLAMAIAKSRERGLKPYAWMFTMNFGYAYGVRSDRQGAIARNGHGQNSVQVVPDGSQVFIDPYNQQAQTDYYQLVQAVVARQPDGVLFDYIRYPRGSGAASVAASVRDLWIYSPASREALINRASNQQGRALIDRYLRQGRVSDADVQAVKAQFPGDAAPHWQGKGSGSLNAELWQLSVAHAAQGVIDFLHMAARPVQQRGLSAGAVFFPYANKMVGQGYDSRLQAWERFASHLEWHAMSYAVCEGTQCIVEEVNRVMSEAAPRTRVVPALAGVWGREYNAHPTLEAQMSALQRYFPQLDSVSHFAYSWQEPARDRARQTCRS